jgi:outer membrane protein OmpA-like peptidoglycan-associated protein
MSRILNASKLSMAILVSLALTGSIQASGTGSLDTCGEALYTSHEAIGEAQTILEQNRYLTPGSYHSGELDQTTVGAIVHFQSAHTLRKTGGLNFETTALLCSHEMAPQVAVATAVGTGPTYIYMPAAIVYRPTSEPLFVEKKPLILEGVEFDIDKATLRPESRTTLDQVAASLKTWPGVMVEIQGHTSEPGTAIHNMELSQRRAEAVRAYFVSEGIDGARLVANGYGETRFIADNSTVEGRQENRRVELHEIF